MLRSIGSVAAGFVIMAVIVMVGTMAMVAAFVPGGLGAMRRGGQAAAPTPTPRYYALNIALSFAAAVVGGWVAALMANGDTTAHLAALAALILAMGLVSAFSSGSDRQPRWYRLVIPLVGVAGVAASGLLAQPGR